MERVGWWARSMVKLEGREVGVFPRGQNSFLLSKTTALALRMGWRRWDPDHRGPESALTINHIQALLMSNVSSCPR